MSAPGRWDRVTQACLLIGGLVTFTTDAFGDPPRSTYIGLGFLGFALLYRIAALLEEIKARQ